MNHISDAFPAALGGRDEFPKQLCFWKGEVWQADGADGTWEATPLSQIWHGIEYQETYGCMDANITKLWVSDEKC